MHGEKSLLEGGQREHVTKMYSALKKALHGFSQEQPGRVLHGRLESKFQTNWFNTLNIIPPLMEFFPTAFREAIAVRIDAQIEKAQARAHGSLTTVEDIEEANGLLREVIQKAEEVFPWLKETTS